MRRIALTVLVGLVLTAGTAGGQSGRSADSCCASVGLSASYNGSTDVVTVQFSIDSEKWWYEYRICMGYSVDSSGVIVDPSCTIQNWATATGGPMSAYDTACDYYIQLMMRTQDPPYDHWVSNAVLVHPPGAPGVGPSCLDSGGGGSSGDTGYFTLSVSPASANAAAGEQADYAVSWAGVGGYVMGSPFDVEVTGLPSGAAAHSSGGVSPATWTIATSTSTPAGTYTLTFTGADGKTTATATATLVVTEPTHAPDTGTGALVDLPAMPAGNGTRECTAARGELLRMLASAKYVNANLPSLYAGSAAVKKKAKQLRTIVQNTLDAQAATTRTVCAASIAGGYGVKPASNGTAACTAALRHIDYVNGELKKVYANLDFKNALATATWTRTKQLNTRRDRLLADLKRTVPVAKKACAKR